MASLVAWSIPTLLTINPIGAPLGHTVLHVTAVLHDYETDLYLPPLTTEAYKQAERELTIRDWKRGWRIHGAVYAVVITALALGNVLIVALTDAWGFSWFPFPLVGWGIGLTFHYLYGVRWAEREVKTRQAKIEKRAKKLRARDARAPASPCRTEMGKEAGMTLEVDVPAELLRGNVEEGYGPVADAFRRNFAERGEVGAACAVYHGGRKVVDLWGGYRDGETRAEWREDTVVVVFSATKGVSSLALALAHSRVLLDYDERVATYWPEFAWRGKGDITVRQLLSHQAGVPVIDVPLKVADLADLDLLAAALALQRPLWEPGTRHGYHTITLGWYEGELLRRVDPKGRSLGRFFAEEIAAPLGLDFWIGLPDDVPLVRRATIHGRGSVQMLLHLREYAPRTLLSMLKPGSALRRSVGNPPELLVDTAFNTPEMLAVEIPAGNGIGEPRAVAAAYDAAISGGLGLGETTLDALIQPAQLPIGGAEDALLKTPIAFSLGYMKPSLELPFGSSAGAAFGTPGNGGSFAFADPDTGIAYCYAPNRLGFGLSDEREIAIRDALYTQVLGERTQRPGDGAGVNGVGTKVSRR